MFCTCHSSSFNIRLITSITRSAVGLCGARDRMENVPGRPNSTSLGVASAIAWEPIIYSPRVSRIAWTSANPRGRACRRAGQKYRRSPCRPCLKLTYFTAGAHRLPRHGLFLLPGVRLLRIVESANRVAYDEYPVVSARAPLARAAQVSAVARRFDRRDCYRARGRLLFD
jgi:hypothetical protein